MQKTGSLPLWEGGRTRPGGHEPSPAAKGEAASPVNGPLCWPGQVLWLLLGAACFFHSKSGHPGTYDWWGLGYPVLSPDAGGAEGQVAMLSAPPGGQSCHQRAQGLVACGTCGPEEGGSALA